MQSKFVKILFVCLVTQLYSCSASAQQKRQNHYTIEGRTETTNDGVILIGSASSVAFSFTGDSVSIGLKSLTPKNSYVSLELDGNYIGRFKIEAGNEKWIPIPAKDKKSIHHLSVFKATEAANGGVLFIGTTVKQLPKETVKKTKKIEFIGNSITCGMGNDAKEIPCGTGEWYDQHNAYWAYGPIISRKLNVDFQLSSVSGIGMYRNWNDEHNLEPIMPQVYGNLYLNTNTQKPYISNFQPDIISICLGTNDLSDGDGIKPRLPFNEEKYISNYVNFIKMLLDRNLNSQIVLLNSPMVNGDRAVVFEKCLEKVKSHFNADKKHKPILIFKFKPMLPNGCTTHPDIDDHKIMAAQYAPFLKNILDEK